MKDHQRLLTLCELAQTGLASSALLHELRQPVFALMALEQQGRAGWQASHQDDLQTLVGHLVEILEAWAPVGRQEAQALHDVRDPVRQAVRMLAERVELEVPEAPVWSERRPGLARQVTVNLVRNALDASGSARVRLTAGEQVQIEVRDRGPGPADLELFEPFVTTKGSEGTGLGLYVSRQLCLNAGGDVSLTRDGDETVALAWFMPS